MLSAIGRLIKQIRKIKPDFIVNYPESPQTPRL